MIWFNWSTLTKSFWRFLLLLRILCTITKVPSKISRNYCHNICIVNKRHFYINAGWRGWCWNNTPPNNTPFTQIIHHTERKASDLVAISIISCWLLAKNNGNNIAIFCSSPKVPLVWVSEPWRAILSETMPFKGPQRCFVHCFWKSKQ